MAGYPRNHRLDLATRRPRRTPSGVVGSSFGRLQCALDQYIIEHPEYFFERPPESAHVNLDNSK